MKTEDPEFSGKTVLITGGSSGIGLAAASLFIENGAQVFILGRSAERLAGAAERLASGPGGLKTVSADISKPSECRQAIASVLDTAGHLDVLVNSAGVYDEGPSRDVEEETWDQIININLKGTFFMCRYAIPALEKSRGSIVNVGSDSGLTGNVEAAVYCASKGGITLLTKSLAVELAKNGIRVNAVCPGIVETPMVERDFRKSGFGSREEYNMAGLTPYPEGTERFVNPEEVAESILFLASDRRAGAINGACLPVDFGLTAGY